MGESQFSHMLPCPQDSPTPLVIPQAALCPRGNPEAKSWPNGLSRGWRCPTPSQTPGAEAVLAQLLFLQQTKAVQFDRARDEANLTALLYQPPDPPVIIVFLQTMAGGVGETKREIGGASQQPPRRGNYPRSCLPCPGGGTLKEPHPWLRPLSTAPIFRTTPGPASSWAMDHPAPSTSPF